MSKSFTIKFNLQLIRVSQFLQQFKFNIYYKLNKEYIIQNTLNHLINANIYLIQPFYLELDTLFVYNIILIAIHTTLISKILAGYNINTWWLQFQYQIQYNNKLDANMVFLLFILDSIPLSNANPYLTFYPKNDIQQISLPNILKPNKIAPGHLSIKKTSFSR